VGGRTSSWAAWLVASCLGLVFISSPANSDEGQARAATKQTTLDRLRGHWATDMKALNRKNAEQHKPIEVAETSLTVGERNLTFSHGTRSQVYAFILAGNSIWLGSSCRGGGDFASPALAETEDRNGTVLVSLEEGEIICRTIELLNEKRLVLSFAGAQLNYHYFRRLEQ